MLATRCHSWVAGLELRGGIWGLISRGDQSWEKGAPVRAQGIMGNGHMGTPVDRQNDGHTHNWKHYFPATPLASGNDVTDKQISLLAT